MTPVRLEDTGLELAVPAGVSVEQRPGVDWIEFRFFGGSAAGQILFVYLGDHPRFPLYAPPGSPVERLELAGCAASSIRWSGPERGLHREVLIDRGPSSGRDRLLHCIYNRLSPADAELADALIASLRGS